MDYQSIRLRLRGRQLYVDTLYHVVNVRYRPSRNASQDGIDFFTEIPLHRYVALEPLQVAFGNVGYLVPTIFSERHLHQSTPFVLRSMT